MDETSIDHPLPDVATPAESETGPGERERDLEILERLELELAEVEAALQRLDGTDPAASAPSDLQP